MPKNFNSPVSHQPLAQMEDIWFQPGDFFTLTNIPHKFGWAAYQTWGYEGTGPRDFAANILFHFAGDKKFAEKWFVDFCAEVISLLPHNKPGELKAEVVSQWIVDRRGQTPNWNKPMELSENCYQEEYKQKILSQQNPTLKNKGGFLSALFNL